MRRRIAILLLPLLLAGCANGSSATFDLALAISLTTLNQIALLQLPTMSDEELAAHRADVASWEARAALIESALQTHLAAVDAEIALRQAAAPVVLRAGDGYVDLARHPGYVDLPRHPGDRNGGG